MLTETIIPWVLGTLSLLALLALILTVKAWRDMKRSPYFFMRRQAEQQLQSYSTASLMLLAVTAVFSAYIAQRPQTETVTRVAILSNAKPPEEEIVSLVNESKRIGPSIAADLDVTVANTATQSATIARVSSRSSALPVTELPEQFDQYEPKVELSEDTALGQIFFSTDISDDYEALNPRFIFAEGDYTLYATFSYEGMADGMEWAWVWRHNGKVVDGGNELWAYGEDGPGYIFYGPEEGFQTGEYLLEVWVNGELMTQATAIMNGAAVTVGN